MPTVGVIGAGTMGAGIAQVAAASEWSVLLMDADETAAQRAIESIGQRFDRKVAKGKLSGQQRQAVMDRLHVASNASSMADCSLIIEAVIEDLDVKVAVLQALKSHVRDDCILASNTSSLSIGEMGRRLGIPERVVGMHFFNPVPVLPLVEVVSGPKTSSDTADKVDEIGRAWGKTVVRCKDTPGFIVNRVARGYYLESLRLLGEGVAGIDEIDATMKRMGSFRMGPFELMDLVGIDVNYTVSCSVYQQMGEPARLKPHPIQADLFERKQFGRKSGRGFYVYDETGSLPAVTPERADVNIAPELWEIVRVFAARAAQDAGSQTEQYIFARVLVAIINEACLALDDGVATSSDIDLAMKTGTNYPKGPLEWADAIGFRLCRTVLDLLNAESGDGRFAPAAMLNE